MAVQLNHTIVWSHDQHASAAFVAEILGLPAPVTLGPFTALETANGVGLDYLDTDAAIVQQHYAFLVTEDEFDAIHGRIRARDVPHWADPAQQRTGEINHHDGGRGVYFEDPDGHLLEIITRPYAWGG